MPAAEGPQATEGPQFWFQVNEDVKTGYEAVVRVGRREVRRDRMASESEQCILSGENQG